MAVSRLEQIDVQCAEPIQLRETTRSAARFDVITMANALGVVTLAGLHVDRLHVDRASRKHRPAPVPWAGVPDDAARIQPDPVRSGS
jgi:hypothetical protein